MTDLLSVSAVAPMLWWAEVVAKVALMAGSGRAADVMTGFGVSGALVGPGDLNWTAVVRRGKGSMNPQIWWFVSRSSGIIAWALVSLSVCWGLFISTKAVAKASSPAWLLDFHRYLGGLSVVFTAIHLIGLAADNYVDFGWAEMFVPMSSDWKPGAVAFGIVGLYLLVASR